MATEAMKNAIVGIWCNTCEVWLNGLDQSEDHEIGKKHRNNARAGGRSEKRKQKSARSIKNTKFAYTSVIVPAGTCLILEQGALIMDANQIYLLSLYEKAAFRSRL